ncbi:hypothetical protein [Mucilaginibacter gossypii]|uniref:Uncharacterized protein n=1 Tax=Mucilaginibacter gossypii TaxID=551996 RepID=A0A1G8CSU9_9SPHI|nr:hypothetical protein [Mucilaginibacter gossypii]SDH48575.1 hypothetical protein SAMN05192573_11032 [Mucilaginibacter gossypii]
MIRNIIDRFSCWYNNLDEARQVYYYFAFCLLFLGLLWLSIHYIGFDTKVYTNSIPQHIGKPSGPQFNDSLTLKKH